MWDVKQLLVIQHKRRPKMKLNIYLTKDRFGVNKVNKSVVWVLWFFIFGEGFEYLKYGYSVNIQKSPYDN